MMLLVENGPEMTCFLNSLKNNGPGMSLTSWLVSLNVLAFAVCPLGGVAM